MPTLVDPYGTGSAPPPPPANGMLDPYGMVEPSGVYPEVPPDPYDTYGPHIIKTSIMHRRGLSTRWTAINPILKTGEIGYEVDSGKFKMGDGATVWSNLDYFLPESDVIELVEAAVAVGAPPPADLANHINSETPHPVYDDGPSLALLYQNATV